MKRLSLVLACGLGVMISAAAAENRYACVDPLFSVEGATENEAPRVCADAISAKKTLSLCGMEQARPVTFELRDSIDSPVDHCAGLYQPGSDRVLLISRSKVGSVLPDESVFSVLDDETFYASLVLHELSHAVMDQMVGEEGRCGADYEYVAYALQIESLPEDARQKVVSNTKASGAVDVSRLNDVLLGFKPDLFAVRAWKHFSEEGNGCDFVSDILSGDASLALPHW
ncbi:MAG: hypothetical protein QNJ35_16230 [Paracoccaceae bacterium]|nr:hypothetical protein [Paracoccaceae bacterium]